MRAEGIDVEDTGRLLEELHKQLKTFFGKAPKGKLKVEVWSTEERWADSIRKDGAGVPTGAGGYYWPTSKKAYLYVQPSEHYTRQLILHEATHQFHYLAGTGNRSPGAFWYTEGLAEYFGMHTWDGKTLQTGVVPPITLEDYPKKALANFDNLGKNLEGMVSGKVSCERPEAWALIHYLATKHTKRFKAFRKAVDRSRKPAAAWRRYFGKINSKFISDYRNWILSHQQPWRIAWTSWQAVGEEIEGRSDTNGLCLLKEKPTKLVVQVAPTEETYLGGIVFGFQSTSDFFLFQVNSQNEARVMRYQNRKWNTLHTASRPPPKKKDILSLSIEADTVTLHVNGQEIGTYDAPGEVGLNVDSCTIRFRVR